MTGTSQQRADGKVDRVGVVLRFGESEIVALFRERHDFKPGDTLHLRPRKELVHLFDPQNGQRV